MSFLLPHRSSGSASHKKPNDQTQADTALTNQSASTTPPIEEDKTDDRRDEATALQALNEAYFVDPGTYTALAQSSTLIPYPIAKLVTATTGLGTFTVRSYAGAFKWGLSLGRETTLRSLEITRAGIEGVLRASAKDVSGRRENNSELASADTENFLARSISALHWAFTGATFATSAGFKITETYLQGMEHVTLQGLGTLNTILGSTESSRAVSAIITLIKEELTRPGAEDGLVPGYWDLMVGCAGFVILQRLGRRKTALEFRGNGGEETIWDLVIDDKGFRADVVGTKRNGGDEVTATGNLSASRVGLHNAGEEGFTIDEGLHLEIPPTIALSTQDQTNLSDEEIRNRILAQMPPGARAVITTDTVTLKTVQVDIHSSETAHVEAPPGLTMISEDLHANREDSDLTHQRIVFRTSLTRSSSAEIEPIDRLRMTSIDQSPHENGDEEAGLVMSFPKRRNSYGEVFHDDEDYLLVEKPLPKATNTLNGPIANQKKARKPVLSAASVSETRSAKSTTRSKDQVTDKAEKAGMIKKALQSLTPTNTPPSPTLQRDKSLSAASRRHDAKSSSVGPLSHVSELNQKMIKKVYPSTATTDPSSKSSLSKSPSTRDEFSKSYFTMHEKKRESTMSQTDSFSIHSTESRPGSPVSVRTYAKADSSLSKNKSYTEISMQQSMMTEADEDGNVRHHHRSRSFVPSLYSMGTKHSDEAIILQPKMPVHRSIFEDHNMLTALATDGKVPGMFPDRHFVKSIRRFARFASASYGSNFLRIMGITSPDEPISTSMEMVVKDIHHEHSSFAMHTGLPADTILLSGFCDPKGGPVVTSKSLPTMTPLMHFISIDHDSKAIVLTCRGTLGFEDVLTDMICDYDDINWLGQVHQVHKGIHACARRMLEGGGRRVMNTIQASLEEFPEYGLIMCGHSLGGAVAAVLALLISEPNKNRETTTSDHQENGSTGISFVTRAPQRQIGYTESAAASIAPISLPTGRPIHVFAYGPPASFSPSLRLATRGLITTIINHNDIVPSLSLGTLHDFKAVAIHLKQDPSSPLVRLKSSMIERVKHAMLGNFWNRESTAPTPMQNPGGAPVGDSDEEWQWTALTTLRNLMISDKLLPPGEVFVVETSRVFDRLDHDPELSPVAGTTPGDSSYRPLGRPATRVQFKLIRNVESRFREIRFGSGMFGDHSPGRYEGGLGALERGIFEEL